MDPSLLEQSSGQTGAVCFLNEGRTVGGVVGGERGGGGRLTGCKGEKKKKKVRKNSD